MECAQAIPLISARIDGEVEPDQVTELARHLADCAACRELALSLEEQHAALRQAFEPRRLAAGKVAERRAAQLRAEQTPVTSGAASSFQNSSNDGASPGNSLRLAENNRGAPGPGLSPAHAAKSTGRIPWLPMLWSAAAGFLIAVLV